MVSTSKTGFVHSIPVPRIYKIASKVAKNVKEGRDSLKNLVYAEKHVNIKTLYALVIEVFKRNDLIDELIQKSNLLVNEPRFNIWLAKILISELLWGRNKMCRGSKPVDIILKYEEKLRNCLKHCMDSIQPVSIHNIMKPRYVRVNTLKISLEEAVNNFREEGWTFVPYFNGSDYIEFQNTMMNLKENEFMKDIHIPNLLIFPPKTQFYQHGAYKSGQIMLQDKASCLPVQLLAPPPGSVVLDTCAAPGMKTTQLAALLGNKGTVYAIELNPKRETLLKELVESVGATCVKTILKDVMQVTCDDCPGVEYILVDPSCSGSGITDRIEIEKIDLSLKMERLKKLCNFQAKLLRYSMNAFPNAKRIVYSTCSVNSEENEDVVRQILETSRKFKLIDAKKLLPSWNSRTSDLYTELGNMCIYATPEEDKTNGFFVAVFERLQEGEKNPYLNFELCNFFDKKRTEKSHKRVSHKSSESKNITDFGDEAKITEKQREISPSKKKGENDNFGLSKVSSIENTNADYRVENIESKSFIREKKSKNSELKFLQATENKSHSMYSESEKQEQIRYKDKKRKRDEQTDENFPVSELAERNPRIKKINKYENNFEEKVEQEAESAVVIFHKDKKRNRDKQIDEIETAERNQKNRKKNKNEKIFEDSADGRVETYGKCKKEKNDKSDINYSIELSEENTRIKTTNEKAHTTEKKVEPEAGNALLELCSKAKKKKRKHQQTNVSYSTSELFERNLRNETKSKKENIIEEIVEQGAEVVVTICEKAQKRNKNKQYRTNILTVEEIKTSENVTKYSTNAESKSRRRNKSKNNQLNHENIVERKTEQKIRSEKEICEKIEENIENNQTDILAEINSKTEPTNKNFPSFNEDSNINVILEIAENNNEKEKQKRKTKKHEHRRE